ncbi:MAG: hypothetical protein K2G37_01395 [Clostridia bacterium]|nr:hypothetical protein [Clostridia bacterium]MDE7329057.1 hypothetical protein [Clostridia bacterium]
MLFASNGLTFLQELEIAFGEIGILPAILLILGTIFIIVEIFNPGFGFFGVAGIVLVVFGIAIRLFTSRSGNLLIQFFVMVLSVALVVCVALIIMVHSMKKGRLSRTSLVQKSTAVPSGITQGTEDFTSLLGKSGVANSVLRPSGNATIDGKLYSVVSQSALIESGKAIQVVDVEGVKITVVEI